jgi:hypothetical protein
MAGTVFAIGDLVSVTTESYSAFQKPFYTHIIFEQIAWQFILHSLYSSPNIVRMIKSRRMRWAGHVARMGQGRGVYRVLVGRPEGKRPLGRPRRRWEDNIKMDLREKGIDGANWIRLVQDRVQWRVFVNTVMDLRVP